MDPNIREVARKTSWSFSSRVVRRGALYFTAVLLGRLYGPAIMGTYFLFLSYTAVVSVLAKAGMGPALVKSAGIADLEGDRQRVSGLIRFALRTAFLLWLAPAAFLVLFPEFSAGILFHAKDQPILSFLLAAAILAKASMELYDSGFLALRRVKRASLLVHVVQPVTLLGLVTVAWFGTGPEPWAAPAAYVLSLGLPIVAFTISAKTLLPPPLELDPATRRSFIRLALPLLFTSVTTLLMSRTDLIVLGQFRPSAEVGLYAAASRTAWLLPFLLQAFSSIMPTRTAQLFHEGRKRELEDLVRKTSRWSLIFSMSLCSVMIVFPEAILSLFGKPFGHGAPVLVMLALAQTLNAGTGVVSATLAMTGHERALMHATAMSAILNVALDLALVPRYGGFGAALATGISIVFFNGIRVFWTIRKTGIVPYATGIPKLLLQFGTLTVLFFLLSLKLGNWVLPIHVAGVMILALLALGSEDLKLLREVVRRKAVTQLDGSFR